MVRLRLKRFGRRHRPYYRITAFDARAPRDGRAIDEELGTYDPLETNEEKKVTLNRERIIHWLDRGAQPSESVAAILKRNGIHLELRSRAARRRKRKRAAAKPAADNA